MIERGGDLVAKIDKLMFKIPEKAPFTLFISPNHLGMIIDLDTPMILVF